MFLIFLRGLQTACSKEADKEEAKNGTDSTHSTPSKLPQDSVFFTMLHREVFAVNK